MRRRPLHGFKVEPRRQRGAVVILLTVAMVALLAMAGLALDGGHLMLNKTRLQNAVDAAALSGAKTLGQVVAPIYKDDYESEEAYESAVAIAEAEAINAVHNAVKETLRLNAEADGNDELGRLASVDVSELADDESQNASLTLKVEFSNFVDGSFTANLPANPRYVRVWVRHYELSGFFWQLLQSIGDLGGKEVGAVAVAGPSPTAPCDLAPLLVCADPDQKPSGTNFWGYKFGQLEVLKSTKWQESGIGPGNFQLLDYGSGGKTLEEALAGGLNKCYAVGDAVKTEPGNKVGPVRDGFNTRFYGETKDLVSFYETPLYSYAETFDPPIAHSGQQATADDEGNISAGGRDLFDYNDWRVQMVACASTPESCSGVAERRMLKIVLGNCSAAAEVEEDESNGNGNGNGNSNNGKALIPVLGFGCFFVLQPIGENGADGVGAGNESHIFGQFVSACEGDNYPGPNPSSGAGPQIIQLYKSYITPVTVSSGS